MIYKKNPADVLPVKSFQPFYTHRGFDSKIFPKFQKYLIGRSLIILNYFLICMPLYARTREWNIFGLRIKNKSTAVPIRLLTNKKSLCAIIEYIMDNLVQTFERLLMTYLSARSNLVIISQKKNPTSNRCKPIGVLTRTKSSCSDERLPISYSLPDFKLIWSKFLMNFTSLHFTSSIINLTGVDPSGGASQPTG